MLVLLSVFLLIFTAFAMVVLHLVRPRLSIQGFLAVVAILASLVMIFLARADLPGQIVLLRWAPQSLFPMIPTLLLDESSWYFVLALTALTFTVVSSSIAQLGQGRKTSDLPAPNQISTDTTSNSGNDTAPVQLQDTAVQRGEMPGWLFWSAVLVLTSIGLLAVTAGNVLTLLLTWAALDLFEMTILLSQIPGSADRERVTIVFSARLAGIVTVLIAELVFWSQGGTLQLDSVPQSIGLILILAAGIRLGVFPPQHFYTRDMPIRSDLATILRLVSAAACFILLVRVSEAGVPLSISPLLLALTAVIGIFAAINWLGSKDALNGRSYWILGTSTLAIASAVAGSPIASLVWSLASLLSGGLIFSFSLRHRRLLPLILLGIFNLSSLPFSPTWQGTTLYQALLNSTGNQVFFIVISLSFLIIQSFLLAGYIRHFMRELQPVSDGISLNIERWVWVLYPLGLLLTISVHLLIGVFILPELEGVQLITWLIGPLTLLVTAFILFISWRFPQPVPVTDRPQKTALNKLFSLEWLYKFIWQTYHTISRLATLFSAILEGDGGILWALVLFALIFVFLQVR